MVGILKNEIAKATTSDSSTTSIFSTPLVLEELSMFLFPDLSSGVLEHESGWEWFEENYGTVMATANLWLFLLMRSGNEGKNICGIREYDGRIEERWAGALRSWLESCDKGELQKRALETQVEMVQLVMERIKKEQEKSV